MISSQDYTSKPIKKPNQVLCSELEPTTMCTAVWAWTKGISQNSCTPSSPCSSFLLTIHSSYKSSQSSFGYVARWVCFYCWHWPIKNMNTRICIVYETECMCTQTGLHFRLPSDSQEETAQQESSCWLDSRSWACHPSHYKMRSASPGTRMLSQDPNNSTMASHTCQFPWTLRLRQKQVLLQR